MNHWNEFLGPNAGYALELYERYLRDPQAVDAETRAFFSQNPPPAEVMQAADWRPIVGISPGAETGAAGIDPLKVTAALNLAQSIRWYGHFAAALDPLGSPPPGDRALLLETYGLTEEDLRAIPAGVIGGFAGQPDDHCLGSDPIPAPDILRLGRPRLPPDSQRRGARLAA